MLLSDILDTMGYMGYMVVGMDRDMGMVDNRDMGMDMVDIFYFPLSFS